MISHYFSLNVENFVPNFVAKFIIIFTNRFVNNEFDWLLFVQGPIRGFFYKLASEFQYELLNFAIATFREKLFLSFQELGLSNDGNESAVHGQTISPGQSPIHVQATNLGQLDALVLDEQRAPSYPALVTYQRSVFM